MHMYLLVIIDYGWMDGLMDVMMYAQSLLSSYELYGAFHACIRTVSGASSLASLQK